MPGSGADEDADEDVAAKARSRLGTTLRGKYHLDRVLGVGGMAAVYAATHRNGSEFAVKLLHPELSFHADLRKRFLREGHAASAVKHPGAVKVFDDDVTEDGAAFLVMELLQGEVVESIWERLQRRAPLRLVVDIGIQLLDVLAAAHERGVIHRDIKPANLFLLADGQLKVLDFGIARLRDALSSKATQSGMMMGTPAFMAPEQVMGKTGEIDGQTDVWAVGATMFTLLSGRLVHEADTVQELMIRAATTPASPTASILAEMPPALCAIVDRALAFAKDRRWPTAAAMRNALLEVSTSLFGPESIARSPPAPAAIVARNSTAAELVTAQPVSRTWAPRRAFEGSPARLVVVLGSVGSIVAAGALVLAIFWHRPSTPMTTPAPPPGASGTAAHPIVDEDMRDPNSAPKSIAAPVVGLTAPSASVPRAEPVIPATGGGAPSPISPPVVKHPSTSPPTPVTAAPTTATTKAGCNPPFEMINGIKRWKRNCLTP